MRIILSVFFVGMMLTPVAVQAHGGGCRKSSPPGQCCHMDHKTGIVHCH